MTDFLIRSETIKDRKGTEDLLMSAFPTSLEASLVRRLRKDGDVAISLVAVTGTEVIGHVLFSRMRSPKMSLALAPVAVTESRRREGVAFALIAEGLERARADGWRAAFVLGDPAYYERFGFSHEVVRGKTCRYFGPALMGLILAGSNVTEPHIEYAPAFPFIEESV